VRAAIVIARRAASLLIGVAVTLCLIRPVHALDDSAAKLVIAKFLSSQKIPDGPGSAGDYVIADLDGDGKADIVLLWDVMGPTYSLPKMTIFLDQGKTYRTLTTDLWGQSQKLTVMGPMILVDTLTMGPNDPRCCPTLKMQLRFRWADGKLSELNSGRSAIKI
jgi:hypothetical protein